jgi:membrane protease YdiL (CAAX protease family)
MIRQVSYSLPVDRVRLAASISLPAGNSRSSTSQPQLGGDLPAVRTFLLVGVGEELVWRGYVFEGSGN